jgi:hypothetical protein
MKRPQGHENPKTEQQQGEDRVLRTGRNRVRPEIGRHLHQVERALRLRHLQVERDQPRQRDQRPEREIKRDLKRGVVLPFAAPPHPDHDERGHEREFVEGVEEKQIERRERSQHTAAHHQQQDVKLLLARLDLP